MLKSLLNSFPARIVSGPVRPSRPIITDPFGTQHFKPVADCPREPWLERSGYTLVRIADDETAITTVDMPGGAQVLSRMPENAVKAFLTDLRKGQNVVIERLGGRPAMPKWPVTRSSLLHLNISFKMDLADEVLMWELDNWAPVTILDWGCGSGATLAELGAEACKKSATTRLFGFGNIAMPQWLEADNSITFILDDAKFLSQYFAEGTVDIMYSHFGLRNIKGLTSYLESIVPLLSPNGRLITDDIFKKPF